MVNDVSGGTADPDLFGWSPTPDAMLVVMHMRGTPQTMQAAARYDDVVREVGDELRARVDAAVAAGVGADAILADPGIGFAKTRRAQPGDPRGAARARGARGGAAAGRRVAQVVPRPVLGDAPVDERDDATLATTVWSFVRGAAVVRVHDVAASSRASPCSTRSNGRHHEGWRHE